VHSRPSLQSLSTSPQTPSLHLPSSHPFEAFGQSSSLVHLGSGGSSASMSTSGGRSGCSVSSLTSSGGVSILPSSGRGSLESASGVVEWSGFIDSSLMSSSPPLPQSRPGVVEPPQARVKAKPTAKAPTNSLKWVAITDLPDGARACTWCYRACQ